MINEPNTLRMLYLAPCLQPPKVQMMVLFRLFRSNDGIFVLQVIWSHGSYMRPIVEVGYLKINPSYFIWCVSTTAGQLRVEVSCLSLWNESLPHCE